MRARSALYLTLAASAAACLPGDGRPEPGRVYVTAEPSEGTRAGFVTSDGWAVTFERFLTALGDTDLESPGGRDDDACTAYSEARYEWLFDFTVAGREKVGVVHGLGSCLVELRLRGPSDDAVLGAGATGEDADAMRPRASDAYADDERVTLVARGTAALGGVTKRFDWRFRRSYEVGACPTSAGGRAANVLDLEGGDDEELRMIVRGEELFRRGPSDAAPLEFGLLAAADTDADGAVTLDELALAPAPPDVAAFVDPPEGAEPLEPPASLADLVYVHLLPRIVRVDGSLACEMELRD